MLPVFGSDLIPVWFRKIVVQLDAISFEALDDYYAKRGIDLAFLVNLPINHHNRLRVRAIESYIDDRTFDGVVPLAAFPPPEVDCTFRFPFPDPDESWNFGTQHAVQYHPTFLSTQPFSTSPLTVPGIIQIYLFGDGWKLVHLLSPLGHSIAWRVSFNNWTFDEDLLDPSCECRIETTHGVSSWCDSMHWDTSHPDPWVQVDRANLHPHPNKIHSPRNKFLSQVRDEQHSTVTRFCELTRESRLLYIDFCHMLDARVQQPDGTWTYSFFALEAVSTFLLDAGINSYEVARLTSGPYKAAKEYKYT